MRWGRVSSTLVRWASYSSGVAPRQAKTRTSPGAARAAATSSWVERGLHPVTATSAPPARSTRARYAVFASRWMLNPSRRPAKGRSRSKRALIAFSSFMCWATQRIFRSPCGAKLRSRTSDANVDIARLPSSSR